MAIITRSLSRSLPDTPSNRAAATKIRKFFRRVKKRFAKSVARTFLVHGPKPLDEIEGIQFGLLSEQLRKDEVVDATSDFLCYVIQHCNWGRVRPLITGTVNAKIYIAAYMIASQPEEVFDDIAEPLAQKVIKSSQPLVEAFHKVRFSLAKP